MKAIIIIGIALFIFGIIIGCVIIETSYQSSMDKSYLLMQDHCIKDVKGKQYNKQFCDYLMDFESNGYVFEKDYN